MSLKKAFLFVRKRREYPSVPNIVFYKQLLDVELTVLHKNSMTLQDHEHIC